MALIGALLALALLGGCSQQQAVPAASNGQSEQAAKVDPATVATISGVIHFNGPVPAPKAIDMSGDPDCHGQNQSESLVVHDGRLANVVVYVKDGLPQSGWMGARLAVMGTESPDPISGIIRQSGCRYEPHVGAIMAGQSLTIYNNDLTTHNVHPVPQVNRQWNVSQLPHSDPVTKTFREPELMIPLTCNVHPWMRAYINVLPNPFFAVSSAEGNFTIQGLPPGTYTIGAVHESLGEQTAQITVAPKQNAPLDFTFSGPPKAASAAK